MPKQIQAVNAHWDHLIENFQTSSLGFYEAVEAGLQKRAVPEFKASRVDFKEAGLLTAKREYLRVVRGKTTFDICAAPFGTGFFISWWMVEQASRFGLLYLGLILLVSMLCANIVWPIFLGFGLGMSGFVLGYFLSFAGTGACFLGIGYAIRNGPLNSLEEYILVTPLVKTLYERIFNPPTYYVVDTGLMFQQAVHNTVLEVIDQVTAANGVRALSELERKPILRSFAQSV